MIDVVWDMETHDPDDYLTLLLLLGHPEVNLKGVTVTPGSPFQVAHVRRALAWFERDDIPVGAHDIDHPKECVSSWHGKAFGPVTPCRDAEPGGALLHRLCDEETTLITGGPLKNLGAAMQIDGFRLGRLVAQGGFAGEGVVPPERQLPKFAGRVTCPTFNLNGDPKSALRALSHPGICVRRFVSKNVCHGVVYDEVFHERIGALREGSLSLRKIWEGMEVFLGKKRERAAGPAVNERIEADPVRLIAGGENRGVVPLAEARRIAADAGLDLVEVGGHEEPPVVKVMKHEAAPAETYGKKLHDPLAACCAIDEGIGEWAEVELYRSRNEWGAYVSPGSGTWIITGYDHERFVEVFTASAR